MEYKRVVRGVFLHRPNRFIAICLVDGKEQVCHVKNTGRCRELLISGVPVVLSAAENPMRKTPYDVIAVWKGERLINIDSQMPNAAVREFLPLLFPGNLQIEPERRFGQSRFDFYLKQDHREIFLEVKGVTLEENGVVWFPDAPTVRGTRHVRELISAVQQGYEAYLLLVIQMENVLEFRPNRVTDPAFADAIRIANDMGVRILAYDCSVSENSMTLRNPVKVVL